MSPISVWTLFVAVLLSQKVTTNPSLWPDTRTSHHSEARLSPQDALEQLASIIQYLKSIGLSNDRIQNTVDDNLELRQHQDGSAYGTEDNRGEQSSFSGDKHQKEENIEKFFENVLTMARSNLSPESFIASRIGGSVFNSADPVSPSAPNSLGSSGFRINDARYLVNLRHQINLRGPTKSFPDRHPQMVSLKEEDLNPSALIRVLMTYPKSSRNRRKFKNRKRPRKFTDPGILAQPNTDGVDSSLTKDSYDDNSREAFNNMAFPTKQAEPNDRAPSEKGYEKYGPAKISKPIEYPLPPIRGVSLEMTLPDDVIYRQTVALSPGLSVYRALYQAALSYENDERETNPFDVSVEPDDQRKCYVIAGISGFDDGDGSHWLISVTDARGEVKYEGLCLMSNSKLPLRSGYKIHIEYDSQDK